MLKITPLCRTTKTTGAIRLRFRVRDGRFCDLTLKSEIIATLQDLNKLDSAGQPHPHVMRYNRSLCADIAEEIECIRKAYNAAGKRSGTITTALLQSEYERIKYPERSAQPYRLQTRFEKFIFDNGRAGVMGADRQRMYKVLSRILYRFLTIKQMQDIAAADFTAQYVLDFRDFVENEYRYTAEYSQLYTDCKTRDIPMQPRSANTTAKYLKMLQAFFSELESMEEIEKSPYRKITKDKKQKLLQERYTVPIYLYAEELQRIISTAVPEELREVQNAFALQCAIGCRVGDFKKLTTANIATAKEGFFYVHYLPEKTAGASVDFAEVQTPLVKYAAEIIARCGFSFPILRNVTGQSGYNAKIKELLQVCGIDRQCVQHDDREGKNKYVPLYELGSSKLARKTFVDMLNKVQVNMYAAGLHKEGSGAVKHYTQIEMHDRYLLMCRAFRQPQYTAGKDIQL